MYTTITVLDYPVFVFIFPFTSEIQTFICCLHCSLACFDFYLKNSRKDFLDSWSTGATLAQFLLIWDRLSLFILKDTSQGIIFLVGSFFFPFQYCEICHPTVSWPASFLLGNPLPVLWEVRGFLCM